MLTLGEKVVMAARLAALEHIRQSVSPAHSFQHPADLDWAARIGIGGAGPVLVDELLSDDPRLPAQRLRQAGRRPTPLREAA